MHIAASPAFYQPRSLSPAPGLPDLPESVREALTLALQKRAELLLQAPGIDRATYCDRPPSDRIEPEEDPAQVSALSFANAYWPHRWGGLRRWRNNEPATPEGVVQQRLLALIEALRRDGQSDAADMVRDLWRSFADGDGVQVQLRVRAPVNRYGVCVEDITYAELTGPLPETVCEFIVAAHNALIALLAWLDADLTTRRTDRDRAIRLEQREAEQERRIEALLARERRHHEAVKKVKAKLAQEKADAKALLEAANQRMAEAMTMAALVVRTKPGGEATPAENSRQAGEAPAEAVATAPVVEPMESPRGDSELQGNPDAIDWLAKFDEVKKMLDLPSEAALARELGVPPQFLQKIRARTAEPSAKMKLAAIDRLGFLHGREAILHAVLPKQAAAAVAAWDRRGAGNAPDGAMAELAVPADQHGNANPLRMPTAIDWAAKFDELREKHGLQSDAELAEHFGCTQQALSKIRHGGSPSAGLRLAILEQLGYEITPETLLLLLPDDVAAKIAKA